MVETEKNVMLAESVKVYFEKLDGGIDPDHGPRLEVKLDTGQVVNFKIKKGGLRTIIGNE